MKKKKIHNKRQRQNKEIKTLTLSFYVYWVLNSLFYWTQNSELSIWWCDPSPLQVFKWKENDKVFLLQPRRLIFSLVNSDFKRKNKEWFRERPLHHYNYINRPLSFVNFTFNHQKGLSFHTMPRLPENSSQWTWLPKEVNILFVLSITTSRPTPLKNN